MRVEILKGVERRRRWSEAEKALITEESFAAGAKVSDVARKHGVSRGLIFAWRKEARVEELSAPAVQRLIPAGLPSGGLQRHLLYGSKQDPYKKPYFLIMLSSSKMVRLITAIVRRTKNAAFKARCRFAALGHPR
jgi:hypothetical protein